MSFRHGSSFSQAANSHLRSPFGKLPEVSDRFRLSLAAPSINNKQDAPSFIPFILIIKQLRSIVRAEAALSA
jgi:hypothetical protein